MKNVAASLMMLVATHALAEEGKPTKAQTVDYIQSNYPDEFIYIASEEGPDHRMSAHGAITDIEVSFVGTKLTATYHDKVTKTYISQAIQSLNDVDRDETRIISFDLKDVESIDVGWNWFVGDVSYKNANDARIFPMFLAFNAAGKKPLFTMSKDGGAPESLAQVMIPFTTTEDIDAAIGEIKGSQMFKAFEHLRKLSGAPDPIRF